jgi:hypothetical protein
MSWRLPPPIWIATEGRKGPLGKGLHAAAVAWRLARWCVASGAVLALLEWLTRGVDSAWVPAAWLAAGALLLLLWERYGLADSAIAVGRCSRWIATIVIALLGGCGTWLVAHGIAALARALGH